MTSRALISLLALAAIPPDVSADAVFRCVENGKTIFTETAIGPSCQRLDLKVHQPDPRNITRRQRELDSWNYRRDDEVRRILDREAAARTQRQQAELRALGTGQARNEGPSGSRRSRGKGPRSRHGNSAPKAGLTAPAAPAADMIEPSGRD